METSADILKQIEDVTGNLPEGEEDSPVGSVTDEWPRTKQLAETAYEADPDEETADYYENRANLEQQWRASEMERMKNEFGRTGVVPQAMNFEEWQLHREIVEPRQDFHKALAEEIAEIKEKYPLTSERLLNRISRGKVEIPDDIESIDNALETLLVSAAADEDVARKMSLKELEELINGANEKQIRSKSMDIAQPKRVKPKPTARRQPTYTLPDLTQADLQEALNWAIQKKMRGGR